MQIASLQESQKWGYQNIKINKSYRIITIKAKQTWAQTDCHPQIEEALILWSVLHFLSGEEGSFKNKKDHNEECSKKVKTLTLDDPYIKKTSRER
jgi:hypothetical protein